MEDFLFYSYSSYLKDKYKVPAFRVGIDAGFSCPNRKNGRNSPGCSYCDTFGARAMYQRSGRLETKDTSIDIFSDIKTQTKTAVKFLKKRYKAEVFLLYLQAFSGTNGTVQELKKIYDFTLNLENYRELIVSTRPDCIDDKKAALLLEYKKRGYDVWVELGLQSSNEDTLKRINRGHGVKDFENAFSLLRERGIKIAVHLIFGLPGEGSREITESCNYTAMLKPDGVKFHNLHIPYNSPLYTDYKNGLIDAPGVEEHLEYVISAIELMPRSTIIMRVTCDSNKKDRAAPKEFLKKTEFYNLLRLEMKNRKAFQSRLFRE